MAITSFCTATRLALSVLDSEFVNNTALSDALNTAGFGGAIIIKESAAELRRNSFVGNRADSGGALYYAVSSLTLADVSDSFSRVTRRPHFVANSTLFDNSAGIGGGAIYSQGQGGELGTSTPGVGRSRPTESEPPSDDRRGKHCIPRRSWL